MISRRSLITGLVSLVAAPAIVRASSLMAVKPVPLYTAKVSEWNSVRWVDTEHDTLWQQIAEDIYPLRGVNAHTPYRDDRWSRSPAHKRR